MLHARGIEGTRVLQGLLSLTKKHPCEALEKACEIALSHGAYRLRTLRQLLKRQAAPQQPLPFLDEHPIIRPLDDYAQLVARAIHRQADRSSVERRFYEAWQGVRGRVLKTNTALAAQATQAARHVRRALDPAIPRQVAPQQSPTPFHRTTSSVVPPSSFHQE